MRRPYHILALALALSGWTRAGLPTAARPAPVFAQHLDYVTVLVNGEPHPVPDGGELAVVRGDTLLVKEAVLKDPAGPVRSVGVLGFRRSGPRRDDDRGYSFTTQQLKPRYSEGGKGESYVILVTTRTLLHGAVYLRIIPPVLRYAEININGAVQVMRDGEPLTVHASDQVKVARVVTNLPTSDGVLFQIDGDAVSGTYAIRFLRGGAPFAQIPLRVVD